MKRIIGNHIVAVRDTWNELIKSDDPFSFLFWVLGLVFVGLWVFMVAVFIVHYGFIADKWELWQIRDSVCSVACYVWTFHFRSIIGKTSFIGKFFQDCIDKADKK